MRDLLQLYRRNPSMYALDCDSEGFEWTTMTLKIQLFLIEENQESRRHAYIYIQFYACK